MHIRPLAEADVSAFKALRLRGLIEEPTAFCASTDAFASLPEAAIIQQWQDLAAMPGNFVHGAFLDGRLVGIAGLTRAAPPKLRHKALLWGMYVAPEARGHGFGQALVESIISSARAVDGLEQILLVVTADLPTARDLYVRLGFETYGIEPQALKLPDGYRDAEEMLLRL